MADPLAHLVHHLSKLPGIGERSATRLAFYVLRAPESYARDLAQALTDVRTKLCQCNICCMLTDSDPCRICSSPRRDTSQVMVVASPQDVMALERGGNYQGHYHVLHGLLSPLEGVGPDDLSIKPLLARLGSDSSVEEVILGTAPNVEGDATALYLAGLIKPLGFGVSRIASGVPIGGELEYADNVTLNRAIEDRRAV